MTNFVELIESGRKADHDFGAPKVVAALQALVERCDEQNRLDCEGVWRLHRREVVALRRNRDIRPAGSWRSLCALAVGTGAFRAEEDAFVAGDGRIDEWAGDPEKTRIKLVESFVRWLIPPATAAGLFLAMNVHPLWGLRLARRLHVDAPIVDGPVEGWRDEALLPDEALDELRKGVFAALSTILSGLRKLRRNERYCLESLRGFVAEALAFGRNNIEEIGDGLEVLIDDINDSEKATARSMEFAAGEFFDGVLVPAGVMRRFDDGTFAVDVDLLESVRVGRLGRDAQRSWFQTFLVDHPGALVA